MPVATKITISVSDDLHERLQAVKERLNVSGVCQGAIEQAVRIEEIKMSSTTAIEKVIERLRVEKQAADSEWKEIGIVDGLKDAEELSYEEFRAIASSNEIPDNIDEWIQDRHIQDIENPNEDLYREGWKEGVLDFWEKVKGQL